MLNWTVNTSEKQTIHSSSVSGTTDKNVCDAIESCVDKAVELLKTNIQDDSLYLLFEWNPHKAALFIVVTNSNKQQDSPNCILCNFVGLEKEFSGYSADQKKNYIEQVKFWLHDYLTVCSAFFSYSLVAIFHCSTRNQSELL